MNARILRSLLIAGVAALALLGLAAPAQAKPTYPPTGPTLTLSATVVVQGTILTATGRGLTVGATFQATVFSEPVAAGSRVVDQNGTATWDFDTSSVPLGSHTFSIAGTSGEQLSADFTVVSASQAGFVPSTGDDGSGLAFTGANGVPVLVGLGALLVLVGAGSMTWARRRASGSA